MARIVRLAAALEREAVAAAIEAIFWETVAVPPPPDQRAAFRDLWFGQYLRLDPDLVFVALDEAGAAIGYLVGTCANAATSPRFDALPYFQAFRRALARYPAHLHINLTAAVRGRGVGRDLIEAFVAEIAARGLPGCHVVTGATARNVTFYARQGFREVDRSTNARGDAIVCLGRAVA